jgi:tetratricopeptide (TPR) repeat protein
MIDSEIWNELGDIYYNTGAYDQAILIYQKGLALDPSCNKFYCNLASIFIHQRRYTEAIPMLQKGIEFTDDAINKAGLWSQLGDAYRKLEEHANAVDAYRKAIELSPQDPVFQKNLAEVESTFQGVPSASVNENGGETILPTKIDPSNGTTPGNESIFKPEPLLLEREDIQRKEKSPELLACRLESAGNSTSGNACWVYGDNEIALREQQDPLAASETSPMILGSRLLSNAISGEDVPNNPPFLEESETPDHGNSEDPEEVLLSTREEPVTLHSRDETASNNPTGAGEYSHPHSQSLLRLGILHWRKGEYEKSIQFLKAAIDASDKSQDHFIEALCYYAIALVDTDLGRIDEAIHAYQSAANLAPENIFPWNNLGNLNCMLARYDDAKSAYQEAIEHNPKNSASWNGLGDVYHRLGRNDDAIAAYQLGNVFENRNSEKDALTEFEMSIDSNQGDPQVWIEAGNIYFNIGLFDDAIASYQKAIDLDPSNATVQASLAKAEKASGQVHAVSEPPIQKTLSASAPKDPQGKKANNISKKFSSLPEVVAEVEPEGSYWVFDTLASPGNSRLQATRRIPADAETPLSKVEPILDSAHQTQGERSFSSDQAQVDIVQKNINVLVQLSPRPLIPTTAGIINPAAACNNRGSASAEVIPESKQSFSKESETRIVASCHGSAIDIQVSNPPSLDLQTLEKDINAYRRVTELNPKNDRAWDALGNMFEKVGLHDEAIAAFEQAIALSPLKDAYHYHLGIAHAYQMHFDKAILALQRVVELNPDFVLAHCALAGYYRKLGMQTEAQEHIKKARPSMVNESEYNQACFESISGNADRAFSLLEIALEKDEFQPAMVRNDPDLDFIRTDPRFEMLIQRNRIINL